MTGSTLWMVLPNLLLVIITAYYAWQTRQTVKEMSFPMVIRGAWSLGRIIS
jgi:hypothetical protein